MFSVPTLLFFVVIYQCIYSNCSYLWQIYIYSCNSTNVLMFLSHVEVH